MLFAGRCSRSVGDRGADGSRLSEVVGPESGGVTSPRSHFRSLVRPLVCSRNTPVACPLCAAPPGHPGPRRAPPVSWRWFQPGGAAAAVVFPAKVRPLPASPPWRRVTPEPQSRRVLRRLLTQITLCPVGDSELKAARTSPEAEVTRRPKMNRVCRGSGGLQPGSWWGPRSEALEKVRRGQ